MESKAVVNPPEANLPVVVEKSGGGGRWDQVRSAVLRRGWSLGKKVAIAGAAISCAPVVIPPLLFFSTLGLAVAFPFGVYLASFAYTDLLMRSLLPPPPQEKEQEEEEEFFEPEEEMESEGEKTEVEEEKEKEEENVPQLDHDIEEKGDGGVVEEERQMEEAGMGKGKELVEDNKEEECGGGTLFYDEDMRKDFAVNLVPVELVCADDRYSSEVFEDRNRVEIVTEEQLMEEMKMPEEILVENEKNQEDKVEGTAQGLPPTAFPFDSVAPLEKEIEPSSQYASADEVGGARLGAETGGEEMEEEMGGGEQMEAEAEVKEEEGLDAAAPKSKESVPSADEVLEDREVEIVPSLEHASDAKDGGDTGDRGLVRQKSGVEEKGRNEGGVDSTAQEVPPSVDPSLVVVPQDTPMEEMGMEEELGAEQKVKNEDIVCFALEHESKIKQSSLSLVYGSKFEKGYEGAVGILEEEIPTEELGLGEAYAVEEMGDEGVGIKEEEKLTEVGLPEAYVVEEEGYEGNVGITEEEKLTEEVAFGDAYAVDKGYGRDVGILEEEKPREDVGLGEAYAFEYKDEGDVGKMEEEKQTKEVGLGEACVIEEKGYRGDVGMMEEEKPTEEVGLGVATAVEEKTYEADIGITEEKKPTEEVGLLEASAVEKKGNQGDVGLVEDKKLTEEGGLEEEREEKGKEDERVDCADFESENLLPSAYPSEAVAPEASKNEIEQSLEFAADVKEGGNRGSIGLMEEEKPVEQIEVREEITAEEKGRKEDDVDASTQKPPQNVYPFNNAVLEEHEDSVKPSSLSSECPSMFKGNGYGVCVETVEEGKLTEGAELRKEIEEVQKGEEAVDTSALESEKLLPSGYASVAALLEECKAETEPISQLACDVKNSGNKGGIGLVGEEKLLEEMDEREGKGLEENEYTAGAASQGFSQCVYPSVGEVLEEHMNQVKQSNRSSEFASVIKEKGHEGEVEMIEEKKPTEGMHLGEERQREAKEEECVDTAAMETEKLSPRAYLSESVASEVCEVEIELSSLSSEYASFVKDDGEGIGIKLVEEVQPTEEEMIMEEKKEAENKVMKQEGVGAENKEQLQNAEHFVDVVSTEQKIETEQSGVSLCDPSVVKQNEDGDCIEVLEEKILLSNEAGMREEREVLVEGKEEDGDNAAAPKNDGAVSSADGAVAVVAMEIKGESEPSGFNSEYLPAVEYQSLDMAETESRSSIEHGLDLSPGPKAVAVDTEVPVSSDGFIQ
ncbi:enolase-phosphatase E1-like isoform X2 [Phoenix dactylifera]|uniref:Enolase-phosphatase E1-like isoform X2 n=1 Tax=Phoenix dactylifera TaxID=42345 RepID=A0A8B8ZMY1_PHODC|nr:enolase-phosphatase E1-like isoform X2 [Phoenix dactylifera]